MDRKAQLKNVAFGGAWSEAIPVRESNKAASDLLERAPSRSHDEDLRLDQEINDAFRHLCKGHPKADSLAVSWRRALDINLPDMRATEIKRITDAVRAWVAKS